MLQKKNLTTSIDFIFNRISKPVSKIKILESLCESVDDLVEQFLITLKSRAAINENCMVRGIGVAVKVKVSTLTFRFRNLSFAATPNFCSSSMTSNPKSLKPISLLKIPCVPMTMSIFPCLSFFKNLLLFFHRFEKRFT